MGSSTPVSCQAINNEIDHEESSSSQDLLSAIVQIRKVTSRERRSPVHSARDDSQMTVYNISEITDNGLAQTNEAAVQTSVAQNMIHPPQPYVCPYMTHYQDNIMKYAPFERSERVDHPTQVPIEKSFGHTTRYIKQAAIDGRSKLANFLGIKCKGEDCRGQCELYKINIEQAANDKSPPRKLVFDLVDEPPRADTKTTGTNTKDKTLDGIHTHNIETFESVKHPVVKASKSSVKSKLAAERMDIYYFDHGNTEYFRTTDSPPVLMTEYLAERTEYYTKRFWAQLFGTIHIGVSFVTSFILQLLRFILQALIRPLTVGLVQMFADYFIKPCLAVVFNGLVQPPMIFLYNVATSVRDVCEPVATGIGYFIREIAVLFKAIRLVQVDGGTCKQQARQLGT